LKLYDGKRPLLNLGAGEPNYAPAKSITDHVVNSIRTPDGGKYTRRQGIEKLRELVAFEISAAYAGNVTSEQVLITAGCNQAFCLAISALADRRDEVILPIPYYFNHDMWLQLEGISPIYLQTAPTFVPDPHITEKLITKKTRAIVLVTPGNPTGVTLSPTVINEFAEIAIRHDIVLILDETYRVFRFTDDPAHELFQHHSWSNNVVSLHSFSKEFAIPGYRVGAAIAHQDLITEMMKLFDCIAICAPRVGQEAAIAALTSAKDWRYTKILEMREKLTHFKSTLSCKPGGFELISAGAFYGWVRHPFIGESSDAVVRRLLIEQGIVVLPGTLFCKEDDRYLRFSFGNLSFGEIDELGIRLSNFS